MNNRSKIYIYILKNDLSFSFGNDNVIFILQGFFFRK